MLAPVFFHAAAVHSQETCSPKLLSVLLCGASSGYPVAQQNAIPGGSAVGTKTQCMTSWEES